ncbi:MAG: MoaD/ThiS family protein [Anaerolineae bacterium]|nr:MoaD/ThiS family protein [Anaerolineae bacterium]
MNVLVEFAGISRVLIGIRDFSLFLEPDTSYRDLIRHLGIRFPALLGVVITSDGESLLPENKIALNGKRMIQDSEMDASPSEGDRLMLMSILAGG